MKKILLIITLVINLFTVQAINLVCYPSMNNNNTWDCFGSNGTCSGTWKVCNCTGCTGSGGSNGCSTCCCSSAPAFPANNNANATIGINGENQLILTISGTTYNLGNVSQLGLATNELFQFDVNTGNRKVNFLIYNGNTLLDQVKESGRITNKTAAYLRTVTLNY